MKKIIILFLFLFSTSNIVKAVEGEYRMGVEFGYSLTTATTPLKPSQELANQIGTLTHKNDSHPFVGRIFSDYGITSDVSIEIGYFRTSPIDVTYTVSGVSSTVSHDLNGFDLSGVVKDPRGFYGKVGMHTSKMNGPSQVTVGSSTGTGLTTESDGTGVLLGVGYENNNIRYSFTHYGDVADQTKLNMFSVGWMF